MKNHRAHDHAGDGARAGSEQSLYRAILALESEAECRRFFGDLCTPAELEAIVDRWAVVPYLEQGLPYRKIHELTGVSVTTIGRVARFLSAGNGGYRMVLERLGSEPGS
ncbi:MAG TPA: YerC/YecD family TrpR-related protein [Gammaproteobacteria bacterium]|nr:YerC/YecD family TrpR-related protein [Gammaproteobacteria bacterium]